MLRIRTAKTLSLLLTLTMIITNGCATLGAEIEENADPVESIIDSMSLNRKVEQMLMPTFRYYTDDSGEKQAMEELTAEAEKVLSEHNFGGVILFGENTKGSRKTARIVNQMQKANAKSLSDSKIPLFISVDQEGGYIARLGTGTDTCGNMALGASETTEDVYNNGVIIGEELNCLGINVDFAPVMDVNNNPANPVIGVRSFSSDPKKVAEIGPSMIKGLQSQGVMTSLKHFPGHGDTVTDTHSGLATIDKSLEELRKFELIPFQAGIDAGTDMIMTAHIEYPKIDNTTYTSVATGEKIHLPATLSRKIITGVLREDMGYDGVVVTDALEMDAISKHFKSEDAVRMAINADVDLILIPFDTSTNAGLASVNDYINKVSDMVNNGSITEEEIDNSVRRILKLKEKYGILSKFQEADENEAVKTVGSKEHHDKEWEITSHAMTLIKNDDSILPLKVSLNSPCIIFAAREGEAIAVRYAIERLKSDGKIPKDSDISVEVYYHNVTGGGHTVDEVEDYKAQLDKASSVLVISRMWGVKWLDPSDADNGDEAVFIDNLTEYMHGQGKKVAMISDHLPYDAARITSADAILAAYSNKQMSSAPDWAEEENPTYGPNIPVAVYTAFGGASPKGKLPVDIPKLKSDYSFSDDILYPIGTGLSYEKAVVKEKPNSIVTDGEYQTSEGKTVIYPKKLPYIGANWKKYLKNIAGIISIKGNGSTVKSIKIKKSSKKIGTIEIRKIKFSDGTVIKNPGIKIEIAPYEINTDNLAQVVDVSKKKENARKKQVKGLRVNFSDIELQNGGSAADKMKSRKIPAKYTSVTTEDGKKLVNFKGPYTGAVPAELIGLQ